MEKTWKVILAFTGVFIAGGICGGLITHRVIKNFRPAGKPAITQNYWPQVRHRIETRLGLTPEQREKVGPIVQRAQIEVQGLRRENVAKIARTMDRMHEEIAALLTPEQRIRQEGMRRKIRERIDRERREMRGGRPPN